MVALCCLLSITCLAGLVQLLSYRRMYFYVQAELRRDHGTYRPKVAVIAPCKGLDPGFADNIQKLFEQDYFNTMPKSAVNFEIIFAVASSTDPAYPVLCQVANQYQNIPVKLVVAEPSVRRAQKINNQLCALKHISSDVEVLVFVDSDMIARPDFISCLVAPLADSEVGIATGYRFYIPFKGDWPSLLRSLWNRLSAWELASQSLAFAWGGAMAITRANFVQGQVEKVWESAADDDLSMTTAVKKLGLAVRFVPQCLVASDGDASLPEIIEWTNRQLILTKVYYPALWHRAIMRAFILAVWLIVIGLCLYEATVHHNQLYRLAACAGLSLLIVELFFLAQGQKLWKQALFAGENAGSDRCKLSVAYDRSLWRSAWALPLAHCLLPWITLNSLFTNRISWRGITYELRSPNETRVV